MLPKFYNNVKGQIGSCGIWCGSCVAGNGSLQELSKRYAEIIDNYDLKDWAPQDFEFVEFRKGLSSLASMQVCPGCQKDGGRPDCEIRACVRRKNLEDCSQCDTPQDCPNLVLLETMQTGALKANLFVKTENVDRETVLKNWEKAVKRLWPSMLLFDDWT